MVYAHSSHSPKNLNGKCVYKVLFLVSFTIDAFFLYSLPPPLPDKILYATDSTRCEILAFE